MRLLKHTYIILLTTFLILNCINAYSKTNLISNDASAGVSRPLRVGVSLVLPFSQDVNGQYSGIAIEIWEKIAKQHHWKYTYVPIGENTDSELARLSAGGDLDIIVGPVSINARRLKNISFSQYFFLSSVGVMSHKNEWGIRDIIRTLLSKNFILLMSILLIGFIIFQITLRIVEKKSTPSGVNGYLTQNIWVYFFQKKVDYMPKTNIGRILGIVWISFSATIFIAITSNLTSAMTIARTNNNELTSTINGLHLARVAGVIGQDNVSIAKKHGIYVLEQPTLTQAVKLLTDGKTDGVICDTTVGQEYIRFHHLNELEMSPLTIENDGLAFAVRKNSPILHEVDLGIQSFQDDDSVGIICKKYINDPSNCYI